MLWVLGKLSGMEPGDDVVQVCFSSGGRGPTLSMHSECLLFVFQRSDMPWQPLQQGSRERGLYGLQNGIVMVGLGQVRAMEAGHAQPTLSLASRLLGAPINFRRPLATDLEPLKVSQSYEMCMPRLLVVSC